MIYLEQNSVHTPNGTQLTLVASVGPVTKSETFILGNVEQVTIDALGGRMNILDVEAPGATLRRVEFVGPQVGKELAENGALALLMVIFGIVVYLAFRFEWRFSVAAIVANLHDVVIILGFFAFFQWEFSLPVLAAILAVLGYSVNESVIVFDRVRETFRKVRGLSTPQALDHGITSTISVAKGNMSKPYQNHGSSFQFRKTMKSGRIGSP